MHLKCKVLNIYDTKELRTGRTRKQTHAPEGESTEHLQANKGLSSPAARSSRPAIENFDPRHVCAHLDIEPALGP